MLKRHLIVATTMIVASGIAQAQDKQEAGGIEQLLRRIYPGTEFGQIRATPVPGIHEVSLGRNLVYVSSDGRYWLFGSLYDMQAQRDLTAERMAEKALIDLGALPLGDAITIKRGNGSRLLVVFSDPDCPFCKRLEQELAKLDDLTIHVFLYPLVSIHPEAKAKSIDVWCAKDRAAAWRGLMLSGKTPPRAKASCDHPVDRNIALAARLAIDGTPALFNAAGQRLDGAAPAQRIEAFMAEAAKTKEAAN